jgi:hypothetical protein
VSYQNDGYGLGDRKPSADGGYTSLLRDGRQGDNTYATVDDPSRRHSRGSHEYEKMTGGAAGGAGTGATGSGVGSAGGAALAGGAAGLLKGSVADVSYCMRASLL